MKVSTLSESMESMQHLTFKLEDEVFALEISKVREVLGYTPVTKVPKTPDFMLGVINLRGSGVPVVDMRLRFGLSRTETTVITCIVIVEVKVDGEAAVIGALADSVQEALELDEGQIEPPPRIGTRLKTKFIKGMGKRDGRFIIILQIDKVFSSDELAIAAFVMERENENALSKPSNRLWQAPFVSCRSHSCVAPWTSSLPL